MGREGGIDQKCGGLYSIDIQHAMTHEGVAFEIGQLFASVANEASAEILIRVNASIELHVEASASSTGAAWLYIFEGPSVTGSGTEFTVYNRYRERENGLCATCYHTPTLASTGTTLIPSLLPGATSRKLSGGGAAGSRVEYIMKPDTVYVFRALNKAGTGAMMAINLDTYEVKEK